MSLVWIDWLIIGLYFLLSLSIGVLMSKRAGRSTDFFLGGRKLPWWIAGTSMAATTFAAVIGWMNLAMVKILSVVFPNLTFFGIEQMTFSSPWKRGRSPVLFIIVTGHLLFPLRRRTLHVFRVKKAFVLGGVYPGEHEDAVAPVVDRFGVTR